MIITYHGKEHVKLVTGDVTIGYNPVAKGAKGKVTKYGATVALSSMNLPEYNGVDELSHSGKSPFIVTGPGEYETAGIFIKGVGVETEIAGGVYMNTIYTFTFDNIKVCFLGNLSKKLTAHEREVIDDPDIVFVASPEDGSGLEAFELYTEAQKLSPKIIIPVGFSETNYVLFLKEGGAEKKERLDKLTIKRKDIDMKNGEVIALIES